jgi:hypothetical protein
MATLNITINLDNNAFQDLNGQNEVARILNTYAAYISEWGVQYRGLLDVNGNTVGVATLTRQEEDS